MDGVPGVTQVRRLIARLMQACLYSPIRSISYHLEGISPTAFLWKTSTVFIGTTLTSGRIMMMPYAGLLSYIQLRPGVDRSKVSPATRQS